MPIMIFSFLRDTIKKLGRAATIKEVEDEIKGWLPMYVDHTADFLS